MARNSERGAERGRRTSRRLSDVAYSRILEALFDRQLPAGAFVSQSDLVALLGIPVGPLRDASWFASTPLPIVCLTPIRRLAHMTPSNRRTRR